MCVSASRIGADMWRHEAIVDIIITMISDHIKASFDHSVIPAIVFLNVVPTKSVNVFLSMRCLDWNAYSN